MMRDGMVSKFETAKSYSKSFAMISPWTDAKVDPPVAEHRHIAWWFPGTILAQSRYK
jgi:hypothetical protein